MGLFKAFVSQTRKPEGVLGKMMVSSMNSGHAKLADWGFAHLPAIAPERAVDLGCGGGRNVGEMLKKYPGAHVTAVDYSALSVEKAKAYNKAMIAAGRCTVQQGMCRISISRPERSISPRPLKRFISGRDLRSALPRLQECSSPAESL